MMSGRSVEGLFLSGPARGSGPRRRLTRFVTPAKSARMKLALCEGADAAEDDDRHDFGWEGHCGTYSSNIHSRKTV
jgi:hypothetical protein